VTGRKTIDDLLAESRRSLDRVTPDEALAALAAGGVLVDVRSHDEQARQGIVPGAVHHPLSVLLWRLDPAQPTHNEKLALDTRVMLICREGYASSVAAAQLQELGFSNATDVVGGVDAWVAAGLPVERANGAVRAAR